MPPSATEAITLPACGIDDGQAAVALLRNQQAACWAKAAGIAAERIGDSSNTAIDRGIVIEGDLARVPNDYTARRTWSSNSNVAQPCSCGCPRVIGAYAPGVAFGVFHGKLAAAVRRVLKRTYDVAPAATARA